MAEAFGERASTDRSQLINRNRVRCWSFAAAARREEREYPSWIFERRATPAQRQRSSNPAGWILAGRWQRCSLITERQAMLFRRALPASRQNPAHPVPIYEMASSNFFRGKTLCCANPHLSLAQRKCA